MNGFKKLWHIYKMEYYSAIKKNEFESVVVRWMNLELAIQNKVTHIYMESRKMVLLNLFSEQE